MTERERQQKIASAMRKTAELLERIAEEEIDTLSCDRTVALAEEIALRVRQVTVVAEQFEAGRYLPKESDAIGHDSTPPPAGEGDAP